jgi:hypothetical protein
MQNKGQIYFSGESAKEGSALKKESPYPKRKELSPKAHFQQVYHPPPRKQIPLKMPPYRPAVNSQQHPSHPKESRDEREMTPSELLDEAQKEAHKESQKENISSKEELNELAHGASRVLFKTKTVFPFDLFPNDLIVNDDKVDIIFREFFMSEQIHTEMIEQLKDVIVETSPFFATLRLVDKFNIETSIKYLPTKDALKARDIIQGLVVAKQRSIDLTGMSDKEVLEKISAVGKVDNQPSEDKVR